MFAVGTDEGLHGASRGILRLDARKLVQRGSSCVRDIGAAIWNSGHVRGVKLRAFQGTMNSLALLYRRSRVKERSICR
jgi:hypothetical protein